MASRVEIDPVTRARIAAWVRYYRDRRGWTHERLGKQLGLATTTITNIINGKSTPGLDTLIKMHRGLHRSADDFLDTDPPAAPRDS